MRVLNRFVVVTLLASVLAVAGTEPRPVGADAVPCTPTAAVDTSLVDVAAAGFVPITPFRLADTRTGLGVALSPVGAGCVLRVPLAAADPPSGVTAVALTVTSDRATEPGFVTAFACGGARPDTSSLNPRPADPTPNLAIVAVDSTREVCFFADHSTDLIVDVTGWFTPSGAVLHDIAPTRVLDTRNPGIDNGIAPGKVAGTELQVPIAGKFVPSGATAVAITLTITQSTESTFATAYPCGSAVPPTSTTNTLARRDRGAPALVGLGSDGKLCVYSDQSAHLIVDVTGWYGTDSTAVPDDVGSPLEYLATTRLADSRNGIGWTKAPFVADVPRELDLLSSVPIGSTSVQLNLIATRAGAAGFLTAYPCSTGRPEASAVNFAKGATETAMVTVGLDASGKVCVVASAATDVIVDLFGAYGSPGGLHALVARPNPMDQGVQAGLLDHTVHCPVGGVVSLTIDPAPGVLASVDGGVATAGARSVTTTFAVGGTMRIDLSGRLTESHLLRCLPGDFPRLVATGVASTPGWYVASTLHAQYAFILDQYGVPVWYKHTSNPVIGVWPLANGNLAWRVWTGGGFPGGLGSPESPPLGYEIHDLSGALVGSIGPIGGTEPLDWHELLELPGGGHLVMTYPTRIIGGPAQTCTKATGGTTTTNVVVDSVLVELDAGGNQVWRWNSKDHTSPTTEVQLRVCFEVAANVWALDYMHLNSAERLTDGDYVVSARHFNAVERIDHATGNVEWKLGGTAPTTGVALTLLDANGAPAGSGVRPIGPHDARVRTNGNITVHDNHVGSAPRADEFRLDLGAGTATLVNQRISANPSGSTLGSMRTQPDGSTVIGWGEGARPWLEDIAPSGATSLSVDLLGSELAYRVVKVPAATYDRAVLRAASGGSAG